MFPVPHSKTVLGSICSFVLGSPQEGSEQGLSSGTSFVGEEALPWNSFGRFAPASH